mgnify:CR=1 FL=1
MHRNSQKRYYFKNAIYFITTVTHGRYPYFNDDLFCEMFVEEVEECRIFKGFHLYGYAINPDHVHLLIQPGCGNNYSEVMRSLKTNFSRNANRVMDAEDFADAPSKAKLRDFKKAGARDIAFDGAPMIIKAYQRINKYRTRYKKMHPCGHRHPPFKWQSSFHDHIIRDQNDLNRHVDYIWRQWIRHSVKDAAWCFLDDVIIGGGGCVEAD